MARWLLLVAAMAAVVAPAASSPSSLSSSLSPPLPLLSSSDPSGDPSSPSSLHSRAFTVSVVQPPAVIQGARCTTDDDCTVYNKRLAGWAAGSRSPGGYLCVAAQCKYMVTAGQLCTRSSDCSLHQFATRAIERNTTSVLPAAARDNTTAFLDTICAPQYCDIASYCETTSDPLFADKNALRLPDVRDGSCCRGSEAAQTCSILGSFLDTCGIDLSCSPSETNTDLLTCSPIAIKSTQWIGIIITLVGAATLNVGLNLQKFALRKRHEKVVQKKEQQRSRIVHKIASMRLGLTDLYRKYSMASMSFSRRTETPPPGADRPSGDQPFDSLDRAKNLSPITTGRLRASPSNASMSHQSQPAAGTVALSGADPAAAVHESHLTIHNADDDIHVSDQPDGKTSGMALVKPQVHMDASAKRERRKSVQSTRTHRQSMGNLPEVLDKPEFQTELKFGELVRNPAWVLGMLVFIIGNFFNFIALQFAPQSLVAPLGSISLVVNVIIAPLINNEKWTWKDVFGVVFIVGGSVMVVAFAGVNSKDYNICVLLALFRRPPTIVFLTVTAAGVLAIFLTIVIIEKNLDLVEEPSADTIKETLRGRLVRVETHAEIDASSNHGDDDGDGDLQPTIADTRHGLVVRVRETQTPQGQTQRTLTLSEAQPVSPTSPSKKPDFAPDMFTPDLGTAHSRRSRHESSQESVAAGQMRPLSSTLANLLNSKDTDGRSVHSVRLTFVLDDKDRTANAAALAALQSSAAYAHGPSSAAAAHGQADVDLERQTSRSLDLPRRRVLAGADDERQFSLEAEDAGLRSFDPAILSAGGGSQGSESVVTNPILPQDLLGTNTPHTEHGEGIMVVSPNSHNTLRKRSSDLSLDDHPMSPPYRLSTHGSTQGSTTTLPTWRSRLSAWWSSLPPIRFLRSIQLVPRFAEKIPLDSMAVRIILPFSYASLGGLMATITVLFAKATIHLLTTTFFAGENQFNNLGAWVIFGVTVCTAVGQIYWINMGLQRYDALLQVPVFYVVWTLFDVVGGGIYFDEFKGFTTAKYAFFSLGVGIIFFGVGVLAGRLKSLSDEEKALNAGILPSTAASNDVGGGSSGGGGVGGALEMAQVPAGPRPRNRNSRVPTAGTSATAQGDEEAYRAFVANLIASTDRHNTDTATSYSTTTATTTTTTTTTHAPNAARPVGVTPPTTTGTAHRSHSTPVLGSPLATDL